jgi:ADP-ribosylglycohydrolase
MNSRNPVKDALLGLAVGDALGVPVEFIPRSALQQDPVTGMRAYGTHQQPAGTWSDDSSLSFCLAEMLCGQYDLQNLANRFINWKNHGYWTAHGDVFDIGISTREAIERLEGGVSPLLAGGSGEDCNGNGSLMRILPLLFYLRDLEMQERFAFVSAVSSLTHRHFRSILCCFIYLEFARKILEGNNIQTAYIAICKDIPGFLKKVTVCSEAESENFTKLLSGRLQELPEQEIQSSGYVLHTLEACFWCLLNGSNFQDAVLKAVNLGSDTDTTAAVTGGLAGLIYGRETIPAEWLDQLVRRNEIEDLAARLQKRIY